MSVAKHYQRANRRIIVFYIFAFAAGGVVQPFLNLYLVEVGLSGAQIGLLQGCTAMIAILVTPILGVLADRTQRYRMILRVIVFLKGISAPLLLISNAYGWLVGTVSLRVITASAQDALMNRLTLKHLQRQNRMNFGSVRFWGALSFAVTSLLAGYFARDASVAVMFPLAAILGAVAVFFVSAFPKQMAPRITQEQRRQLPKRDVQLWLIFGVIFLFSFGQSGVLTFSSIFLVEDLGAGNAFIGLLGAVGSLTPLPAYYLADWLLPRFGAATLMIFGFGLSAVSWGGLAVLNTYKPALWLTIFQGFASAIIMVTLVILLGRFGLPQRAATDQMVVQLTIPGIAGMIAQPLSGWLFDHHGGSTVFILGAALAILASILLLLKNQTLFMETTI